MKTAVHNHLNRTLNPDIFPNRQQLLLIKALLANDETFQAKWKLWKKGAGHYENLDSGTLRLFPLASRRVMKLIPNDSWIKVVQNSYRAHWLKNQLLVTTAARAFDLLSLKKIPFMLLKGGAYIYLYYGADIGARNIEDIDIFVPITDFFRTIKILEKDGWELDKNQNMAVFRPEFSHALSLHKGNGHIDVHCHFLHSFLRNKDWQFTFSQAQTTTLGNLNRKVKTFSDTDHLAHVCINGLWSSESVQLRWIIDAMKIMKTGSIDWLRVVNMGREMNLALPLNVALAYLKREVAAPVPQWVIEELSKIDTPTSYKRIFWLNLEGTSTKLRSSIETYWWTFVLSLGGSRSPVVWIKQFYRYIQYLCQTPNPASVPGTFIYRITHLLQRSVDSHLNGDS